LSSSAKNKNLVIVESPAKAKTISKILGRNYTVKASLGHVRDLPKSRLGVDIENNFEPKYVVPRTKSKTIKELRDASKTASTIYLATDPDREGEAISWHLATAIKANQNQLRRVVFHEITDEAIKQAFKNARSINMQLVNAQQARRVLDRLVGYKLSPLLWRKVRKGLSAGRVQSVALKIIVEREREINDFVAEEYWTIEAEFTKDKTDKESISFRAKLVGLADSTKLSIGTKDEATSLKEKLTTANYHVSKIKTKKVTRQPAPPFITSTLQQEAWHKLRFTAKQTMVIAQQLYEGLPIGNEGTTGLITYMRTDSTRVARPAVVETREYIGEKYGKEYVPAHARTFTKSVKGAQEAHEAIRPTKIHREPSAIKQYLVSNQFKLYQLIWNRMVASQIAAAIYDNKSVDIEAKHGKEKVSYLFRTSTSVMRFPGFTVLYIREEGKSDEEDSEIKLPELKKDDPVDLINLIAEQRFTQPPPRFTEASLVRTLEERGIGRPSTYAPILSAIQEREYVTKTRGIFSPTELGIIVNDAISKYFHDIVDTEFTARMEDELDKIAQENKNWVDVLKDFYGPFEKNLNEATESMEKVTIPDELIDEKCPKCDSQLAIKIGRFGKFLACSNYPNCKFTKSYQIKVGVECPDCGGDLIERFNKKRQVFYGCSNYPKCKFATNRKPVSLPCSQCGGLLTEYRGKQGKCVKCGKIEKIPELLSAASATNE